MKINRYITEEKLNEYKGENPDSYIDAATMGRNSGEGPKSKVRTGSSTLNDTTRHSTLSKEPEDAKSNLDKFKDKAKTKADQIKKNLSKKDDNDEETSDVDKIKWSSKEKEVRAKFEKYLKGHNFENVINTIKGYSDKFISYYVECAGKNSLGNPNNLFLNYLNNENARDALHSSERNFTNVYNSLYSNRELNSKDGLNWIKNGTPENCILYFPELFTNIDSSNKFAAIVDIDFEDAKLGNQIIGEGLITEAEGDEGVPETTDSEEAKAPEVDHVAQQQELRMAIKNRTIDHFLSTTDKDVSPDELPIGQQYANLVQKNPRYFDSVISGMSSKELLQKSHRR